MTAVVGSVMLALFTPVLRGAWRDARFRASARAVTARLGYAHSRSIVTGLPVRLVLNRKNNSSHLEIEKQPGQFEPLRTADASERSLPDDTAFADFSGPGVDMSRGQAWITFFPDGTADARRFRIRGKDQQSVTITVHPATGAVTVNEM